MKLRFCQLFGLALIAFTVQAADAKAEAREKPSCILESLEGTVELLDPGAAAWKSVGQNQALQQGQRLRTGRNSRAILRLTDSSVLRISELTTVVIEKPAAQRAKAFLDIRSGSVYFFSREKPEDVQFRTPVVAGAVRGTEFTVDAEETGKTEIALLDGEVEVKNDFGQVTLQSGERAQAEPGKAPVKTALIDAINAIQWTLYYPAVLHVGELNLNVDEQGRFAASIEAYKAGDLLQALKVSPDPRAATLSDSAKIFVAGLHLSVGRVNEAEALLAETAPSALAEGLREMIAAVQFKKRALPLDASLASQMLARSYYQQSRWQLKEALASAHGATRKAPSFGFAWIRVAELEFSFGRTDAALEALETGLRLSPRHAQAFALRGFILLAQEKNEEALSLFEHAISLDGALGNAWLGRGLSKMRLGQREDGRKDLQVASTLESQRSLFRSYLAKAWIEQRETNLAEKELRLAKKLDPSDPTPWLYSALFNQQRNRINEAVRDLEKSQELNDNRGLFRSKLLLDQDRAIRSANLAAIYRDAGMFDVSLREAAKAVNYDYANYSAHLFLANSYDALRDPKRFNLRYETPQVSELLLANLLAPVGGGNLSQFIAQQNYHPFFEGDRFGFASQTEYFSSGDWAQYVSQFGNVGGTSYAVDALYRSENGQRPNNDLEQLNLSIQAKQQITPRDSVYFQAGYYDAESGDISQYYNQAQASPGLRAKENQEPNLFMGYHHEWAPGIRTLLLVSRLDGTLTLKDTAPQVLFFRKTGGAVARVITPPLFGLDYQTSFEAYSAELQQIFETESHSLLFGGRYQTGESETVTELDRVLTGVVSAQRFDTDMDRINLYGYHQWQIFQPLRLTLGLSYDRLDYPKNIQIAPITPDEGTQERISPKVGLLYTLWKGGTLRALYSRSLGGLFNDNSIRLEPTQIAGFNQAYRSLIPESAVGVVPGTEFATYAAGFDQKFRTGTYVAVDAELLQSEGEREVGVLTNSGFLPVPDTPSSSAQQLDYEEKSLAVTVNQLIAREWSMGARYRISQADLRANFAEVPPTADGAAQVNQDVYGVLNQLNLFLLYNHPCGFFGQFQSVWTAQSNHRYTVDLPGDDFWQHSIWLGYRFPRRVAEVRVGLLNLTDRDYQLNPVNLYAELPRERTFTVSLKLNF